MANMRVMTLIWDRIRSSEFALECPIETVSEIHIKSSLLDTCLQVLLTFVNSPPGDDQIFSNSFVQKYISEVYLFILMHYVFLTC